MKKRITTLLNIATMDVLRRTSIIYRVTRATLIESVLHASESTIVALGTSGDSSNLLFFLNNISVITATALCLFTDENWWMAYELLQSVLLICIFIRLRAVVFIVFIFYLQYQNHLLVVPCMNALLIFSQECGRCAKSNILVVSILSLIISRAWDAYTEVFLLMACEALIVNNYMILGWKHSGFMMESSAPLLVNILAFLLGIRANGVDRWIDTIRQHPHPHLPSFLQGVWWKGGEEGFSLSESTLNADGTYDVPLNTSGMRAFRPNFCGLIRCYLNSLHPPILLTYRLEDGRTSLLKSKFLTLPLPIACFSSSPPATVNESTRESPLGEGSYVFVTSNLLRRRVLRYIFLVPFNQ